MGILSEPSSDVDPLVGLAEEYAERYRRGERPALTEYTDRHPALAARIRQLFPAMVVMEEFGSVAGPSTDPRSAAGAAAPPRQLGEYRILREVGRGGMGVVYEAVQESLGRHVALKTLAAQTWKNPTHLERFRREARAVARLHHTNIVPVFGVGEADGVHFYAMQFIQGQSLDSVLHELKRLRRARSAGPGDPTEGPPPATGHSQHRHALSAGIARGLVSGQFPDAGATPAEDNAASTPPAGTRTTPPFTSWGGDGRSDSRGPAAVADASTRSELTGRPDAQYFRGVARIGVQAAEALAYAHAQGILHRDIKPGNLLLDTQGAVWVTDFGLAKAEDSEELTTAGDIVGTVRYMAPERFQGHADPRSDVYALGLTLYEMLTLRPAFDYTDRARLIDRINRDCPPAPRTIDPRIPRDLETVVLKAIAREPGARYPSAAALAEDLGRFLADRPIRARRTTWAEHSWRWCRRNPAVAGLLTAVAALLVVTVGVVVASALWATDQAKARLVEEAAVKKELERNLYFTNIALAERELSADNLGRALTLLDECPEDLREWEWYYLKRLCRVDPVVLRNTSEVHCAAFHPGGEQVAAACADGTVQVLDARSGKVLRTLRGHETYVFSVAFRPPDGRYLASASADRTVRLWDLTTGREVFRRPGHVGDYTGMTHGVAFSPDGRLLVAGGDNGTATVWDAADGGVVHRLENHENTAVCAAFSPDGQLLATGSWGGVLRIWDARTGQLVRPILAHTDRMSAVVFSPDGRRLATAGFDRTVRVWDAATGELHNTLSGHTGVISGLAFSRDGRRLFSSGSMAKTVKIWDTLTGREVLDLRGHSYFCHSVALSPDGLRLASAGGDGTVRIWDATPLKGDEGRESLTREHDHEVWSVAFSPPDGRYIASSTYNGTVQLWDAGTGAPLRTLTHPQDFVKVYRVAFSPDGTRLAAAGIGRDQIAAVKVWETATGREVIEEIRERSVGFFVTFDPTGRYLLREGREHTVQVRDAQTGEVVGVVGRHDRQIWGMAFSPDGRHLATASPDGTVRVWAWDPARLGQRQEPELRLAVHVQGFGNRVAFSPDGLRLATGGEGNTVKIWDAKTGAERETLRGHTGDVYAVAFSPDGRWLATAGEDTTVRLWDAQSWEWRHTLRGHTGIVGALAFSQDSRRLASGSRDRKLKVWDATLWDDKPQEGR